MLGRSPAGYGESLAAVLLHLVVFAAATFLLLWLQDRGRRKG
jgi:hypothetical protein